MSDFLNKCKYYTTTILTGAAAVGGALILPSAIECMIGWTMFYFTTPLMLGYMLLRMFLTDQVVGMLGYALCTAALYHEIGSVLTTINTQEQVNIKRAGNLLCATVLGGSVLCTMGVSLSGVLFNAALLTLGQKCYQLVGAGDTTFVYEVTKSIKDWLYCDNKKEEVTESIVQM